MESDRKEVEDTAFLLKQYRVRFGQDQGIGLLGKAIRANADLSGKRLNARFVHKVLKRLLEI